MLFKAEEVMHRDPGSTSVHSASERCTDTEGKKLVNTFGGFVVVVVVYSGPRTTRDHCCLTRGRGTSLI